MSFLTHHELCGLQIHVSYYDIPHSTSVVCGVEVLGRNNVFLEKHHRNRVLLNRKKTNKSAFFQLLGNASSLDLSVFLSFFMFFLEAVFILYLYQFIKYFQLKTASNSWRTIFEIFWHFDETELESTVSSVAKIFNVDLICVALNQIYRW